MFDQQSCSISRILYMITQNGINNIFSSSQVFLKDISKNWCMTQLVSYI